MIQVLLVDDSAAFRGAVSAALENDPRFKIVGSAATGSRGASLAASLRPTLILMDVLMPDMDGVAATRLIMSESPCPIVVMTSLSAAQYQQAAFEALQAGAVDVLVKPDLSKDAKRSELREFLVAMSSVKVVRRRFSQAGVEGKTVKCVLIGASTGGPPALRAVLSALPSAYPAPVVVAQHLASGFVNGMAQWLEECTSLKVCVVNDRALLAPGTVYFAGDDRHLELDGDWLLATPTQGEHAAPSVDRLFASAARAPDGVVAVLLTGMGADGANAMLKLRHAGCLTIAQDEATSLVYGMPKAAVVVGAATEQLALPDIGPRLLQLARAPEGSSL